MAYNHKNIEKKWQKFWTDNKTFEFKVDDKREKFYVLSMFLYPSGEMHAGHLRNFTIGDVNARYKRLRGYNVLHPTGADAFGLPAENAAIKNNIHPSEWTKQNLARIMGDFLTCGLSFDTSRTFATCEPEYYGFQQEVFIKMYEKGIAFQKESYVNWDPVDQTVLANEQVINGRGWRSDAIVERKLLKQWFFKITDYAEELLQNLKNGTLDGWPEKVRIMQENWIGKSEGAMLEFEIATTEQIKKNAKSIKVYTTRPDTLFGASFLGISIDHPIAQDLAKNNKEIADFIAEAKKGSANEEEIETMEKKGIATGIYVKNPFKLEQELPVYIANFILMDYGTGAIFGCPAHDERDYEFAKKYGLPINEVVTNALGTNKELPFTEEGIAINSYFLNGFTTKEAKAKAIDKIEEMGIGTRKINYRLRDWGLSRQRYWGCPIPMVHCEHCGAVPEKIENLPIKLPEDVIFDGKGNPLDKHPTWKHCTCPICGGVAVRETDTMDTFVDSSWYMLRFVDLDKKHPVNTELVNKIMPMDQYVGGIEHACMHLIYCRFFTKVMADLGYYDKNIREPAKKLLNQGMVQHRAYRTPDTKLWAYPKNVEEREGKYFCKSSGKELETIGIIKMSKSKNNVVGASDFIEKYGADSARLFVLSDTPPTKDFEWTITGIESCWKYLNRVWKIVTEYKEQSEGNRSLLVENHKAIKEITEYMENLEYNRAIARIREFSNAIEKYKGEKLFAIKNLIKLLAPFAPHICEELNEFLKEDERLDTAKYPTFDEEFTVDSEVIVMVQINGKIRGEIKVAKDENKEKIEEFARQNENVKKYIDGAEIKKIIFVPNKLISFVI
ncbi:MAG: leucine--tRNA ligase [Rickettsiales bacterium]|jgi:leucyl-tRNA synthetase|nr:leucine--tRNA ligase [Rickettsiales bacterium]